MSKEIMVSYDLDGETIKLTPAIVKEYLTGGAEVSLPEFKMFTSLCKARRLNPFLREAYIIKFGNSPAQIVVGKDAILKRAILHPKFDGREQGVIVLGVDGEPMEKMGTFVLESETIVGGWAKVYRKDWSHPVYITVSLSEVAQRKRDGSLNMVWANKTATMIEKVALVRALREAFIEDIGGMYDADEMDGEQPPIEAEVVRQDDAFEEKPTAAAVSDSADAGGIDINTL